MHDDSLIIDQADSLVRATWREVCDAAAFHDRGSALVLSLINRYAEPWRTYHNINHIADCITIARSINAIEPALMCALLFHDVIYSIGATDNELLSAVLAREELKSVGASDSFVETVARLIQATDHQHELIENDECLICDIDLSILGRNEATYDEYAKAILTEVGLPEIAFAPHRVVFLKSMLGKQNIFHSAEFRDRYESAARANMKRECLHWEQWLHDHS